METAFEMLLRMSLTGSMVILVVLLARLALKRAPKKFAYALWAVVLFRLLCPVSFTLSMPFGVRMDVAQVTDYLQDAAAGRGTLAAQPSPQTHAEAAAAAGVQATAPGAAQQQTSSSSELAAQQPAQMQAPALPQTAAPAKAVPVVTIGAYIWLAGVAVMAGYSAVSLARLKRRLRAAEPLQGTLYLADGIETPFVLGVLRPRIYLPAGLGEQETAYIVLHERHHICRGDHVIKLLAFAALALHWFNPLVWLAFSLAGRDMEMSCDEAVMKRTDGAIRADYAQSLLNLSAGHRRFAATPLAFGEGAPKARIKNVLNWKKPAAVGVAVAAVAVAALSIILAANQKQAQAPALAGSRFTVADCVYQSPYLSMRYTPEEMPEYMVTEDLQVFAGGGPAAEVPDGSAWESGAAPGWNAVGVLQEWAYSESALTALFADGVSYDVFPDEARQLLGGVTDVWRVSGADEGRFYLVMRTKQDETLLASCHELDDGSAQSNWMCRLERSGDAVDCQALESEAREMSGDENLMLFSFYEADEFLLAGFESGSHMGFATFRKEEDGYQARSYSDFGGAYLYSMTIMQEQGIDHSITVALSRRQDLARVTARSGERYQEAAVTACPAMVVFSWPDILPEETTVDVCFYDAADEALSRDDISEARFFDAADEQGAALDEPQPEPDERAAFYAQFPAIGETSLQAYLDAHPELLEDGWENLYLNEAGFDDEGTGIYTVQGDEVLAIDAKNGILLLRVQGEEYRGVLAIANDPARLSVEMSAGVGEYGELIGDIAEAHGGVLAMTANGFIDVDAQGNVGNGNGGIIAGYTMSNGQAYGSHFGSGYKRLELHEDNLLYIKDAGDPVSEDCTDATEFQPALIIDGEVFYDDYWIEKNPRACIGQTQTGKILMLVIEGRFPDEGIFGASVNTCSEILMRYGCTQAMNLDGGTSAMLWYDGEYVTRCSNKMMLFAGGRALPNAFVIKRAE